MKKYTVFFVLKDQVPDKISHEVFEGTYFEEVFCKAFLKYLKDPFDIKSILNNETGEMIYNIKFQFDSTNN